MSVASFCHAQPFIRYGEQTIEVENPNYAYDYDSQKRFFINNEDRIRGLLRPAIDKINFDHCHHPAIDLLLYADSTGMISHVVVLSSTKVPKIDSLIEVAARSLRGKWNVKDENGNNSMVLCIVKMDFWVEDKTPKSTYSKQTNYGGTLTTWTQNVKREYNKSCADGDFFYDEGVKYYQAKDYKKAVINFSQAVSSNPNDLDAIYNLGMAYVKINKPDKAFDWFAQAAQSGDSTCMKAITLYCGQVKR